MTHCTWLFIKTVFLFLKLNFFLINCIYISILSIWKQEEKKEKTISWHDKWSHNYQMVNEEIKATLLKIITVALLVDGVQIKKQVRVRCVITIDYHLLSRLIDQFNIHINWTSSAPIFLMFSWEIYTYITFSFSRQN